MRDCIEDLARAILIARKIRLESWSADKGQHSMTLMQSADKAGTELGFDTRAVELLFFVNTFCPHQIIKWAKKALQEESPAPSRSEKDDAEVYVTVAMDEGEIENLRVFKHAHVAEKVYDSIMAFIKITEADRAKKGRTSAQLFTRRLE